MVAKKVQLCVVRIGFDDYLLPMVDGLKLVPIMTNAVAVKRCYSNGKQWQIEKSGGVELELTLARANDILDPPANSMFAIVFSGDR